MPGGDGGTIAWAPPVSCREASRIRVGRRWTTRGIPAGESAAGKGVRMSDDLERVFAELATRLPTSSEDEWRLNAATLPRLPERLTTDRLYIVKGDHIYHPAFHADGVHFHADKPMSRNLGLLILAVLSHAEPEEIQIELPHPASAIK